MSGKTHQWNGDEKPAKKAKTNYSAEDVYVPVPGYELDLSRKQNRMHVGYTSKAAVPCRCGSEPVFEQYVGDVHIDENGERMRNFPAQVFVAICPMCETRAKGHGTLDECLKRWNAGEFTRNSVLANVPLRDVDDEGCVRLSNSVVSQAIEDAISLIREKNAIMKDLTGKKCKDTDREQKYIKLKNVKRKLNELEVFFRRSPVMMGNDGDAVLSGIRKTLYPELKPEDRLKIPLRLVKM